MLVSLGTIVAFILTVVTAYKRGIIPTHVKVGARTIETWLVASCATFIFAISQFLSGIAALTRVITLVFIAMFTLTILVDKSGIQRVGEYLRGLLPFNAFTMYRSADNSSNNIESRKEKVREILIDAAANAPVSKSDAAEKKLQENQKNLSMQPEGSIVAHPTTEASRTEISEGINDATANAPVSESYAAEQNLQENKKTPSMQPEGSIIAYPTAEATRAEIRKITNNAIANAPVSRSNGPFTPNVGVGEKPISLEQTRRVVLEALALYVRDVHTADS